MGNISHRILISILVISLFSNCSKDIDMMDDYQDTTIVYGLLNPNDSITYIRIQKGYLSEGDILEAAQVQDSIEYPYKLDVKLKSGSNTIIFDTLTLFNKEDGIFSAPKTRVYYALTKGLLNTRENTLLEINNPKLNKQVSSSTILHNSNTIEYSEPIYNIHFEDDELIEFETQKNARIYDFTLRFHYMEQDVNDTSTREYLYIDWGFPRTITRDILGGETIQHFIAGQSFYHFLTSHIEETSTKQRYYGKIELMISSIDNTYHTYLEANSQEGSIVMEEPLFTNINNGLGIFAARSNGSRFFNMSVYSKFHIKRVPGLNFVDGIPED